MTAKIGLPHTKCPFRNLGSRYRLKIILELQQTVGGGTYILYVCAGTNQAHTQNSNHFGNHESGTNLARFWHILARFWRARYVPFLPHVPFSAAPKKPDDA